MDSRRDSVPEPEGALRHCVSEVGRGPAPFGDLIYQLNDGKDLVTQIWGVLLASGDRIRTGDNFSC